MLGHWRAAVSVILNVTGVPGFFSEVFRSTRAVCARSSGAPSRNPRGRECRRSRTAMMRMRSSILLSPWRMPSPRLVLSSRWSKASGSMV
eukprot:7946405-Pyramimonas_sp.AAC.1